MQLLAAAEEESQRERERAQELQAALDVQCGLRSGAEQRMAAAQQEALELRTRAARLGAQVQEQGVALAAAQAEARRLRGELEETRASERLLAERNERLDVEGKRAQRDRQAGEILSLSLKEQLAALGAELDESRAAHAATRSALESATSDAQLAHAALAALQRQHEAYAAAARERRPTRRPPAGARRRTAISGKTPRPW